MNVVVLGNLHIGGGIDENNAIHWLELGAEKVCLSEAPSRQPIISDHITRSLSHRISFLVQSSP